MALDTYAGLKTALGSWLLERGTADIADRVPEFFALARTRIFYGCAEPGYESEPLRIRFMEADADLTIDIRAVDLPDGYLQQRRLYINSTPVICPDFLGPSDFRERFPFASITGTPRYFTVEGEKLIFAPTPDAEYQAKLLYYQIPDALVDDADADWLTQNAPNVYLFGALAEFAMFDGDEAMASAYAKRLAGAVNSLIFADQKDRWSAAKMAVRPAASVPVF